jgi:RNA polymerase-binding transcription factor DksA
MILPHERRESKEMGPMNRSEQMGSMRERLIKKRIEVFEAHRLSDEARLILSEHDIEPEEGAQKEAIADVLALLDERELKDIQAINRALAKMELGEYGSCEVCGKEIEVERLEAIPWTSVCSKHAGTE